MPITTSVGDILEVEKGVICHQVNCQGVMGAGLALYIRNKWAPGVFRDYTERLKEDRNPLGDTVFTEGQEELFIASIFGQSFYGRTGVHTNYEAVRSGMEKVEKFASERELPVFIPYKIGCGLAGGDWRIILEILKDVFEKSSVKTTILVYTGNS